MLDISEFHMFIFPIFKKGEHEKNLCIVGRRFQRICYQEAYNKMSIRSQPGETVEVEGRAA